MSRSRKKTPAGNAQPWYTGCSPDAPACGDHAGIALQLYCATIDLLRSSDDPSGQRHVLLEPLSRAVAAERSRVGQELCAQFEAGLASGDYDRALAACIALMERVNACAEDARTAAAAKV